MSKVKIPAARGAVKIRLGKLSRAALFALAQAHNLPVSPGDNKDLLAALIKFAARAPHGYAVKDLQPGWVVRILSGGVVGRRYLVESVTPRWLGYYYLGDDEEDLPPAQLIDVWLTDWTGLRFEVIGFRPLPEVDL